MGTDGTRFAWRGISAFRLLQMEAAAQDAEVDAYLDWCAAQQINIVRVFAMCDGLFKLAPETGRLMLPFLLDRARNRGIYVEAVALVDTALITPSIGARAQLDAVAAIVAAHDNAILEGANEPLHPTQVGILADVVRDTPIASLIPYAQGADHGGADETRNFVGRDYVTNHPDRMDGDGGWRWVRHIKEVWGLCQDAQRYAVADEPIGAAESFIAGKRESDPNKWRAAGCLSRLIDVGMTYHYDGGLQAQIPTGNQLACFGAWRDGLTLIPADAVLKFANANQHGGWDQSPVGSYDESRAVRCYSGIETMRGWTLAIGISGNPGIVWQGGWQPVSSQDIGGSLLIEVRR